MKKFIKEKEKLTKRAFVRWNHFSIPHMSKDFIGLSSKSLHVGLSSCVGYRRTQEDTFNCFLNLTFPEVPHQKFSFFSIFDGHGGLLSSDFICKALLRNIMDVERTRINNLLNQRRLIGKLSNERPINIFENNDTLLKAFLSTDEQMRVMSAVDSGGSCAVCVLVVERGFEGDIELICCNVGDSHCVYSRSESQPTEMLSVTHDLKNRSERKRIVDAGGEIQNGRVNQLVNMTRTFGNFQMKNNRKLEASKQILIAVPEIKRKMIQRRRIEINCDDNKVPNIERDVYNNSQMVMLCCDGLTEQMKVNGIVNEGWKLYNSQLENRYIGVKIDRTKQLLKLNKEEFNLKETRLDQMERRNVASIKGNYIKNGVDLASICNDIVDLSVLSKGSLDNNTLILVVINPILVPSPVRNKSSMSNISQLIAENKNHEKFKEITKKIRRRARNIRKKEFLSREQGMLRYRNVVNENLSESATFFENWMEETRKRRMTPQKVDCMTNTEEIGEISMMPLVPPPPPNSSYPNSPANNNIINNQEEEEDEESEGLDDEEEEEESNIRTIEFPIAQSQALIDDDDEDGVSLDDEEEESSSSSSSSSTSSTDDDETRISGRKRKRNDFQWIDYGSGNQQQHQKEDLIQQQQQPDDDDDEQQPDLLQPPNKKSKVDNMYSEKVNQFPIPVRPQRDLLPSPKEFSQGKRKDSSFCVVM